MAISEDTTALVAAQLTAAWATRMGRAAEDDVGSVGPGAYRMFLKQLEPAAPDIDGWIASYKGG